MWHTLTWLGLSCLLVLPSACGKKDKDRPIATDQAPTQLHLTEEVRPALPGQDYDRDAACYKLGAYSCSAEQLRPLGDADSISIDRVMQRSFVFQPWAGERLQQVLQNWPQELLKMASCVSAIYIGSSLNPSHYRSDTKSVYLHASLFAVTPEEKAGFTNKPDPRRAAFDTAPFYRLFPMEKSASVRQLPDALGAEEKFMVFRASSTLVHELAHACDFKDANSGKHERALSDALDPLEDNMINKYVDVYLRGNATHRKEVEQYTIEDFVKLLSADSSVDYYSYSTQYEHFAMLAQSALMYHFMGVYENSLYTQPFKSGAPREEIQVVRGLHHKVCYEKTRNEAIKVLASMKLFTEDFATSLTSCEFSQSVINQSFADFLATHDAYMVR